MLELESDDYYSSKSAVTIFTVRHIKHPKELCENTGNAWICWELQLVKWKKKKKEAKQNIEFETPERGLFVNTYFNTCKCYTKKEAKMHLMILKLTLLLQED